jgi:hypothetical protein
VTYSVVLYRFSDGRLAQPDSGVARVLARADKVIE